MTDINPVTALLVVLDRQLAAASHIVRAASEAAKSGNQNLAIGTLLPAERHCEEAGALFRVILSMHRHTPDTHKRGAE